MPLIKGVISRGQREPNHRGMLHCVLAVYLFRKKAIILCQFVLAEKFQNINDF